MDNIHNSIKITEITPIEEKISEFNIQNNSNLIVSIINAPIGKVAIKSSFSIIKEDGTNGSSIPLGHALFTGTPEQIIKNLALASFKVLIKGLEKNPELEEKRIITPN